MLAIQLQVPGYHEESLVLIIDDHELNEVVDTGGVDILNPDLRPKVDVEVLWFILEDLTFLLTRDILHLRATLDNDVVRQNPN